MSNLKYTVGILSDQVNCNFVAHVQPIKSFENKIEAIAFAIKEDQMLFDEFKKRPDFGNGAIIGESVVIHNGENLIHWTQGMLDAANSILANEQ